MLAKCKAEKYKCSCSGKSCVVVKYLEESWIYAAVMRFDNLNALLMQNGAAVEICNCC